MPAVSRGFTLLELLIVLAIVAMASGVAVPRLLAWQAGAEQRGWRADLRAQLLAYPLQAFQSGDPLKVDAQRLQSDLASRWPAGAEVALEAPLRYAGNGAAQGGVLRVQLGNWRARWQVVAVTGDVVELPP